MFLSLFCMFIVYYTLYVNLIYTRIYQYKYTVGNVIHSSPPDQYPVTCPFLRTCNIWPTFAILHFRIEIRDWVGIPEGRHPLQGVLSFQIVHRLDFWQKIEHRLILPPSFRPLTGNNGYYKLPPGTSSVFTSLPSVKWYTSSVFTHLPSVKLPR